MSIVTPNMNLVQPTVGIDSGLVWENSLNSNTAIIDQHNHSAGNGVQIPPSGINVNTDFSFANNAAINVKSIVFTPQLSLATVNAIYSIGNDLYYNDGASNVVQITSGGTVNATSSGITNGTATASFVSSVLVVNAAANTPANIQSGSILLGNNTPASKFLTLAPPAAMAANFTVTLPSLPASQKFMTLDSSGNMSAPWAVDNSTLEINSSTLQVKALGINTSQIADGAVTPAKKSALGQQISSSSNTFSTSTGFIVDVTNLSVTITTTGRPVMILMIADNVLNGRVSLAATSSVSSVSGVILFNRGGSVIAPMQVFVTFPSASTNNGGAWPVSSFQFMDIVAAGTYTYKVQAQSTGTTSNIAVNGAKLVVYEI